MRHIFFIFLFGLSFGAFAYAGIVPQHTFAAPHIINRQVVFTALEKHEVQSKMMDYPPAKIYAQPESLVEKRFQNSLGISWPSISLPDFSFLWTQQHSNRPKNIYDRGQ